MRGNLVAVALTMPSGMVRRPNRPDPYVNRWTIAKGLKLRLRRSRQNDRFTRIFMVVKRQCRELPHLEPAEQNPRNHRDTAAGLLLTCFADLIACKTPVRALMDTCSLPVKTCYFRHCFRGQSSKNRAVSVGYDRS